MARKITGGRYHKFKKRKLYELDSQTRIIKLGVVKKKVLRTKGGNKKIILLKCDIANVLDRKTGKTKKAKIKNILETPPNRFLARQNIIVKSAIIDTDLGKARVTNRPSQEGTVEATLLE